MSAKVMPTTDVAKTLIGGLHAAAGRLSSKNFGKTTDEIRSTKRDEKLRKKISQIITPLEYGMPDDSLDSVFKTCVVLNFLERSDRATGGIEEAFLRIFTDWDKIISKNC